MVQRRPAPPMGMGVQSCFLWFPSPVACGGGVFGMLVMGGQACFLWFPPSLPVACGCGAFVCLYVCMFVCLMDVSM